VNEKLKDRNTIKEDINKMISSLKEINSKTSKDQKEFFINEIEKVHKSGETTSDKNTNNLLENFNYFKEEIIKKLESKDCIIQELLNNQQILIQQQQQIQQQNQQQLQAKEESIKSFKEESVKTVKEQPIRLKEVYLTFNQKRS
jgi:Tfp pilus tip-associated adhesin PilY1